MTADEPIEPLYVNFENALGAKLADATNPAKSSRLQMVRDRLKAHPNFSLAKYVESSIGYVDNWQPVNDRLLNAPRHDVGRSGYGKIPAFRLIMRMDQDANRRQGATPTVLVRPHSLLPFHCDRYLWIGFALQPYSGEPNLYCPSLPTRSFRAET